MAGDDDPITWVDYYGDHWHSQHRCDAIEGAFWVVDDTDRDPCPVCVTGEAAEGGEQYQTEVEFPGLDVTAGVVLTCDKCDEPMVTEGSEGAWVRRVAFECPDCGQERVVTDIQSGDVR